jgi:dipeptidyl aminopeptidase/acylaminoacyl peptidase
MMRSRSVTASRTLVALACAVGLASAAAPAQATFPGANGRIFFDTPFGAEPSQIFSVKPSGGGVVQLTHLRDGSSAMNPRVSRDGGRVVFSVVDPSGGSAVWMMRADGTSPHRISHDSGYDDTHPNWSPDGSRIVFSRCSQFLFTCRIAIMDVRGNRIRELTHGFWHDGSVDTPVWSPDGRRIAFQSDRGGYDSRVWTVRADGGGLRRLTPSRVAAGLPDWSPDGAHIVFTGGTHVPFIGLMRPDGSGLRRIGPVVCCAQYSPDGTKFTVHDDDQPGLAVMGRDGSGLHTVAGVPASVGDATWGAAR